MVQLETGSYFRDEDAECQAIVDELNELLAEDKHVRHLLPLAGNTLVEACIDGLILAKFVNAVKSGSVDISKMHTNIDHAALRAQRAAVKPPTGNGSSSFQQPPPAALPNSARAVFDATSNVNRVLEGVGKLGLRMTNCGPFDIIHANRKIVLGLLWHIMRAYLLANVGVSGHPELVYLLEEREGVQQLCELGPEVILTRWVNYHIKRDGTDRRLTNFAEDLEDGEVILRLLRRVAPLSVDLPLIKSALEQDDVEKRYKALLKCATMAGCRRYITAENLKNKRRDLNVAFLAHLFNKHLGMRLPTDEELEQLQGVINLLKHQLTQAGRKLDEGDNALNSVYKDYGDLLGRLTNQCESLEEQAIQDSATIDRYRNLLLESQELMAQLKSEIERKDAESLDLIQKHNREADRINELQDRLAGPGSGRKNRLLDALVAIAEQQDRVDLAAEQARVAADAASRDPEQSGSAADAADAAQAERREANALLEQTLRGIGVEWPPREHVDALAEMEKIMTARLENPIARPIVTGAAAIAASPSVRFALDETDDETDETDETDEMVESDDEMMMQRPGNKMGKKAGKKTDDKRARDQARAVKQLEREVAEAQRSLQMMAALEDPVMRVKRLSESFAALHDNMFVRLKAAEERAERMQGINEQLYAKISSIAEQYVIDQQRNACRHCGATCKKCKGPSKKQMQQQNVAGNAANARNAAVTVIV